MLFVAVLVLISMQEVESSFIYDGADSAVLVVRKEEIPTV